MEISPAILARSQDDFFHFLELGSSLRHLHWHIDILDDTLFPGKSWANSEIIQKLEHFPSHEIHLMTANPLPYIQAFSEIPTCSRALIHTATPNLHDALTYAEDFGLARSLVFQPNDLPDRYEDFFAYVDELVCMGVTPGASGQSFLTSSTLPLLERLRNKAPELSLAVDGGIRNDIIPILARLGVTRSICSSALWNHPHPKDAHSLLCESARVVL